MESEWMAKAFKRLWMPVQRYMEIHLMTVKIMQSGVSYRRTLPSLELSCFCLPQKKSIKIFTKWFKKWIRGSPTPSADKQHIDTIHTFSSSQKSIAFGAVCPDKKLIVQCWLCSYVDLLQQNPLSWNTVTSRVHHTSPMITLTRSIKSTSVVAAYWCLRGTPPGNHLEAV